MPEIGIERNAGEFALEIQRVGFPINGIVQNRINVMENIEFGDCRVGVVFLKAGKRPVGDVVLAGTIFDIKPKWKHLILFNTFII